MFVSNIYRIVKNNNDRPSPCASCPLTPSHIPPRQGLSPLVK